MAERISVKKTYKLYVGGKFPRSESGQTGSCNQLINGSCGKRFDTWLPGYDGVVDHKYVFSQIGYNLKPIDLQGAVGQVQLTKFDEIHAKRRENYIRTAEILKSLGYPRTASRSPSYTSLGG